MFESLRQAFRQAVQNFHTELNRDSLPESPLEAMSTEVVDAQRRLQELREEILRVRSEAAQEEERARTCLRREEMARGIGDKETREVARQFALRHLRREKVLNEKATVLELEVRDRAEELEEMMRQLRKARSRREAMSATAGRTGARESLREADRLFAQLNRVEEKIQEMESRAEAAEAMTELDLDGRPGHEPGGPSFSGGDAGGAIRPGTFPAGDETLDTRLAELKRRMARE